MCELDITSIHTCKVTNIYAVSFSILMSVHCWSWALLIWATTELQVFVPDEMKDEKYWCRRKKNNVAAKRSRDARRIKENQIALRAAFLEQENTQLKTENQKLKAEMKEMKKRMAQLESVMPKEKPRDKNEVTASNLSVS